MEGSMNSNRANRNNIRTRDHENDDSKSDSDNLNYGGDSQPKRKRYHRHTQAQIQHMEEFFKQWPHPDERQRRELSRDLDMEPLQIKFWFQNKRTQMKTQHEHKENTVLRTENEKLRAENMRFREMLSNACCLTCGGPTPIRDTSFHEQQLMMENARLREEVNQIDHISGMTTNYVGKNMPNSTDTFPSSTSLLPGNYNNATFIGTENLGMPIPTTNNGGQNATMNNVGQIPTMNNGGQIPTMNNVGQNATMNNGGQNAMMNNGGQIPTMNNVGQNAMMNNVGQNAMMNNVGPNEGSTQILIVELATLGLDELLRLTQVNEPLWVPSMDRNTAILNEEEYQRSFSRIFPPKPPGFKSEASRETIVVAMSAIRIVELFVNAKLWANVFSGVVSRVHVMQTLSPGMGGTFNEAMQVMNAEFQVPSPIVPTRESYFVRHCRRCMDGAWAVVDVSMDQILHASPLVSCRRRPSGIIIQEMPNGHSKVTWVEHTEIEDGGAQSIYRPLITAGLAFGAKRWISILGGYCERAAAATATPLASNIIPSDLDYLDQEGKKSMLKLSERMMTMFCRGVNAAIVNTWSTLNGNSSETIKVMTRKNVDDPNMPFGIHICVATSFWLPVPPKTVFKFLRDHHNRDDWDMLTNGGKFEEMMQFATGNDTGNRIDVYQVKGCNSSHGEVTMLQESRTDATASYIVYAPVDMLSLNSVLGAGDPDFIPLLPSGFAILPDGPTGGQCRGIGAPADSGGSLLTIAFQVLVNTVPDAKLSAVSITVAGKLLSNTVDKIKYALFPRSSS